MVLLEDSLYAYFLKLSAVLDQMPCKAIAKAVSLLRDTRLSGHHIYTMGNGGSSSTASHFASDLNKTTIKEGEPRFKAHCLNDNIPVITAWANDTDFSNIFAGQMENFIMPRDVVIAISVGGNSPNIVEGLKAARLKGAFTIGFVGNGEGDLFYLVDIAVVLPVYNTQQVEDLHLVVCHAITAQLMS